MADASHITLDDIAQSPTLAAELSAAERNRLITRCAAVLSALSAPMAADGQHRTTPEAEPPPCLLSVPQVAELLGFRPSHVYQMIRQGDLPAVRHGKYVRVRAEAVGDFVAVHERQGPVARGLNTVLRSGRDRAGSKADPQAPRALAGGPRQAHGRPLDDAEPLGKGRGEDH